jgi:serine/threonine protein kinase
LAKSLREDRLSDSKWYNLTAMVGSVPYIAPEVTLGRPYNKKCDVFSFTILLYEIVSLKQPYNLGTKKDYFRKVVQGEKQPSMQAMVANCDKRCAILLTKVFD